MKLALRFICVLVVSLLPSMFSSLPAQAARPSVADASGANPKVFPISSSPYGATYGEWSARFWQWAFSMPVNQHPLFDTADCNEGQTGRVWFLGASFAPTVTGGGEVDAFADRNCSVPSGVALFFPIVNSEASTLEGNGTTETELRTAAQGFQDLAQNLFCEVDGFVIRNLDAYRVESPLYTFGPLPDNNLFGAPAGTTSLSVADGVYVMLAPLSAGSHTIHFKGEIPDFNFFIDITYHLTVGPGDVPADAATMAGSGAPTLPISWGLLKSRYEN